MMLGKFGILLDKQGNTRTIASLRHYYATRQLVKGNAEVSRLAENMGTSTNQIKRHYSYSDPRLFRRHVTQQET